MIRKNWITVDALQRPRITFAGALPPPVTGMTAMTQVIVNAIKSATPVTVLNWSRNKQLPAWQWKLMRALGAAKTLAHLIAHGRSLGQVLYYPVSSGSGLYFDIAIAAMARLLGYRLVLHHHVYFYIDRRDWRMAILNRVAGEKGVHVVHCALMEQDFKRQYKTRATFIYVPPTVVSERFETKSGNAWQGGNKPFRLGFLSNLSIAKGLDRVVDAFTQLVGRGKNVRLVLAGPCRGTPEKSLVEDLRRQYPAAVEYRGPVYGPEKAKFFADIDAFLFPTRSESWGIVLTEALAAGRPVVTCDRGCIRWIVRGGCGVVTEPMEDFVSVALSTIESWIERPNSFRAAQAAALRRSAELGQDAEQQLAAFVEWLCRESHAAGYGAPEDGVKPGAA